MGFFKKLTRTLLSPFLAAPPPSPKKSAPKKKALSRPPQAAKKTKPVKKTAPKKAAKRPAKPAPGTRLLKSRPKKTKAAKPVQKAVKAKKGPIKPTPIPGRLVGEVTHFFPQVNAAAVKIQSGTLEPGNELYFKGATTDFKMKINSLQINRVPVTSAGKGAEVGILVKKRVRAGDEVYKLP